jgi:putative ABC transport system ATP-binding protein
VSLLSLEGVSKRYRDGRDCVTALDDVSLEVEDGGSLGVWGVRRSGKTTLLHVAAGRLQPDSGRVLFDGHDLTAMSADARARFQRRGGIGLVSGNWRPQRNQSVIEHVALSLLSDGLSLQEARGPAGRALERAEIADCAYLPADRLSAGERFRVGLARVLVREPRVILIDEPAVLASPKQSETLYQMLRSLSLDPAIAVVITSEELAPVRHAHTISSIDNGRVRHMQQPGRLLQFPEVSRQRP